MGAPTPSMPQNPTNQSAQQPQFGGKSGAGAGGGKNGLISSMLQGQQSQADSGYQSNPMANYQQRIPPGRPMLGDPQQSQPMSTNQLGLQQGGSGKGSSPNPNQMTPDGGNMTLSSTSGQPQMGQPNPYSNTTGSWDNSSVQRTTAMPQMSGGKGKGA